MKKLQELVEMLYDISTRIKCNQYSEDTYDAWIAAFHEQSEQALEEITQQWLRCTKCNQTCRKSSPIYMNNDGWQHEYCPLPHDPQSCPVCRSESTKRRPDTNGAVIVKCSNESCVMSRREMLLVAWEEIPRNPDWGPIPKR